MNPAGFPDYVIQGPRASIPFNSGAPDDNGCYWYLDGEIEGWDSPDVRVTMLPKIGNDPGADGEYPGDLHYRGRTLAFKIKASCPSESAREASRYLLAESLDTINSSGLFLANEETPKQMVFQRAGNSSQGKLVMADAGFSAPAPSTPEFPTATADENGLIYLLDAEVELYGTDPRKYAQSTKNSTFAGYSTSVTNDGNTDTQNMVLRLSEGISGLRITVILTIVGVGAMAFVWPTLPAGAPTPPNFPGELVVDFYNKTIEDGVGNNYYYLRDLQYPWLSIPPGTYDVVLSGGLSDPTASHIVYSDAWI